MPETIENYVSQIAVGKSRRQAHFVWAGFSFFIAFCVFLIVFAPIARANDLTFAANPIYKFCSFICHQIPARSFFIEQQPLAVCARCFGIYCGLLGGFLLYPFLRSLENIDSFPRVWLFAAMIPMAVDWSLDFFDIWKNTHWSRLATGLILGAACAFYIVPALIEIIKLLTARRQIKRLST